MYLVCDECGEEFESLNEDDFESTLPENYSDYLCEYCNTDSAE